MAGFTIELVSKDGGSSGKAPKTQAERSSAGEGDGGKSSLQIAKEAADAADMIVKG